MIRDARPEERDLLEALQRRSSDVWSRYRGALTEHPDAIHVPAAAIAEGRTRVAVDESGRVLGFSLVIDVTDGGGVELNGLFVEPAAMREGVGRELVEDAATRARAVGALSLDVVAGPEAVGFYEEVGFVREGTAETSFAEAFRLRRALSAS